MIGSWARALRRLAGDVLDGAGGEPDDDTDEQDQLRRSAWRLRRSYEKASNGGRLDEVTTVVARGLRDGREALLGWLDLLEEIVQVTEQRFGSRPGQGEFKAAEVKAAVRRLLERSDARSAAVVDLVGPSAIDLFTGWFIDLTVVLLNKNDVLWQAGSGPPARLPLRTRVLAFLLRTFSWPLSWLSAGPPLDPQLYDEVERIARGPGSPLVLIDGVIDLAAWVVTNRDQTLALIDLVSTACDEVEYFQNLTGSETKLQYARNLILVALEEAGLHLSGNQLNLAETVIDLLIEFVVATNNKRGRYRHRPG